MKSFSQELCCSFCRKPEGTVGKLISSPSDYPRAYICDECIAVCAMVLETDRPEVFTPSSDAAEMGDPLLDDAQVEALLNAVFVWVSKEKAGGDGSAELSEVRSRAMSMMGEDGK